MAVEAGLIGVQEDVVVGAQLELKVPLVVGGDVHDDGDEGTLPVGLGDDARGEDAPGRLVGARRFVPAVTADAAATAVQSVLDSEAAAVRLREKRRRG